MLPDRSITVLKIKRFSTADKVYEVKFQFFYFRFQFISSQAVTQKIDLPQQCIPYFFLFEVLDYTFGMIHKKFENLFSYQIIFRTKTSSK
jgi:hypothetical protein